MCHHKTLEKLKLKILVQLFQYDYRQLYLRKGGVKGPITLKPPYNFSELYHSSVISAD